MPRIRITNHTHGKKIRKNQVKMITDEEIIIDHLVPHLVGKPIYQFKYDADIHAGERVNHKTGKRYKIKPRIGFHNYIKTSYIIGCTTAKYTSSQYAPNGPRSWIAVYLIDSNWKSYKLDVYNLNATMLDDIAPIFDQPYSITTSTSSMGDNKIVSLVPFGKYRGTIYLKEEDCLKNPIPCKITKEQADRYREVYDGRQKFKLWLKDYIAKLPEREDLY